jgi:thiamine biosynthesis lipoprotein
MGCDCRVLVFGGPADVAVTAIAQIDDLESKWSRFLPTSEISKLNRQQGALTLVSPETYLLVRRSVDAWRLTQGAFDPTLLPDLIEQGYDRSFEDLHDQAMHPDDPTDAAEAHRRRPAEGGGSEAIEFFESLNGIVLPPETTIEPGGIGKGLAADLVAKAVMAQGATGVAIDIGGDVRVAGTNAETGLWHIEVDDPSQPGSPFATANLADGAVATSSPLRRRWQQRGTARHHLLDPPTGQPIDTHLVAVTAIASEGWWAEALTKKVFIEGLGALESCPAGSHVIALDQAGTVHRTRSLEVAA